MNSPEGTQHYQQPEHRLEINTDQLAIQTSSASMTMAKNDGKDNLQPSSPGSPSAVLKLSSSSMLARVHAGYFRVSLSLGAQALLWRILSQPSEQKSDEDSPLLHVFEQFPSTAFNLLWYLSLFVLAILSIVYVLKCILHFHLVKEEYLHHVGVNYFFAPWASWLILLQSAPPNCIAPKTTSYLVLLVIFTIPLIILDVKIYGQWFTTGKKRLSLAANPTSQITLTANLIAARAAAKMGWNEVAFLMIAPTLAHYLVLYVTLYQRLADQNRLPVILRPVLFLFFAVPSMSSLAWKSISGSFGTASKMLFYLSLFLFAALICRPALFKKSVKKFNIAWWAFSFPLTILAIASAEYTQEVKGNIAPGLMLALSGLSVVVFLGLLLFTILNITRLLKEDDPVLEFAKDQSSSRESDQNSP